MVEAEEPIVIERYLEEGDITYNDKQEKVISKVITVKEKLGRGSFSKVYKILRQFSWEDQGQQFEETLPYAMKVLDTKQLSKKYNLAAGADKGNYLDIALEEIEIFKKIRHDGIIKVFEVLHDDDKIYIIMELANIGSVLSWNGDEKKYELEPKMGEYLRDNSMKVFNVEAIDWNNIADREIIAKYAFRQLFGAISALHEKNIVHRDVKWENVIARHNPDEDRLEIKFIDFSIGKILQSEDEKVEKFEGTVEYQPPEATGEPYDPKKAEIWALGCCLFSFIFGSLPLMLDTPYEEKIQNEEGISSELKDLLIGMLQKDPEQRFSIEDCALSLWLL